MTASASTQAPSAVTRTSAATILPSRDSVLIKAIVEMLKKVPAAAKEAAAAAKKGWNHFWAEYWKKRVVPRYPLAAGASVDVVRAVYVIFGGK